MNWIESLQKIVPWVSTLAFVPKLTISFIVVAITVLFLLLVWTPQRVVNPATDPAVIKAYERMRRVLSDLKRNNDGTVEFRGTVEPKDIALHYYSNYIAIVEYIEANPGNINGTYEKLWEYGGEGRVHITETQPLESVVSAFFRAYEQAKSVNTKASK